MNYKISFNKVSNFIFDIDGVITDGDIYLIGDKEARKINSRDTFAINYASKKGYRVFVISGGNNLEIKQKLENIGVEKVYLNTKDKKSKLLEISKFHNISLQESLYMGDDLPDLTAMKQVLVSTCPYNASIEVKQLSDYVSPYLGGRHAVRDVIEQTMRTQKKW